MKFVKTFAVVAIALFAGQMAWGQKTVYNSFPDMEIDENTQLVTYKGVVNQQGTSEVLYERAVKWANKYFSNPMAVIKSADKIKATLVCQPSIKISTLSNDGKTSVMAGMVYYTLTIETRENRYRYTITEIHKREQVQYPIEKWLDPSKPEWTPARYDHLHQIDQAVKKLIDDLEEGMHPEKIIVDEW